MTATLLTNGKGGGAASFNTASITPPARKLILAVVMNNNNAGGSNEPTMSGNGLTWVRVATKQNAHDTNQRITLLRAMGGSPTTGVATIDFGGQTTTSAFWGIAYVNPTDQSDANGAGAIVQSVTEDENTTDPMSMPLILSTFGNVNNATFAACIGPDGPATPSGFTSLFSDSQDLGPDNSVNAVFKDGSSTTTTFTSSGGGAGVATGVACEIKYGQVFQGAVI